MVIDLMQHVLRLLAERAELKKEIEELKATARAAEEKIVELVGGVPF